MRKFLFALVLAGIFTTFATPVLADQEDKRKIRQLEEKLKALENAVKQQGMEINEKPKEAKKEEKKEEPKKEETKQSDNTFRVFYKGGIRFETRDKRFVGQIGGRIMYDVFWGKEQRGVRSTAGDFVDGTELRRGRMYMKGTLYKHFDYKIEIDFANDNDKLITLNDAFIRFKGLFGIDKKLVQLTVGHFFEPFSLEQNTSSNDVTFIERSMPTEAFSPSRNAGIMLSGGPMPNMTYAFGVFRETGEGFDQTEGSYNFSTRVTFAPLHDPKKGRVLHLGISYSFRHYRSSQTARFRSRPQARWAPRIVDTGSFAANNGHFVTLEGALVLGRIFIQGQVYTANIDTPNGVSNDPDFWGAYAEVSFFVTNDHRSYKGGKFKRTRPKKNFMEDGGMGALEIALRFSYLDLSNSQLGNGANREANTTTLGLNWYLNPAIRVSVNYTHAILERLSSAGFGGSNSVNILGMRFQINF